MSALSGLAVNGAIPIGNGPIHHWSNGIPFNAAGRVVMVNGGLVTHIQNGIPFNAAGEIPYILNDPDHWSCGLPFGPLLTRQLCVNVGGVPARYSSGVPFNAAGRIVVAP